MVTTMKRIGKATAAAVIALGALTLVGAPVFADANHDAAGGGVQLAHMGGGQGMGYGMGPGMMGPGQGMGHGMMGQGMMGYGNGTGPAAPGAGWGSHCPNAETTALDKDLTVDDVRERLGRNLQMQGNERLKVGDVTRTDDDTIVAEIVTVDDSLVQRLEIDRHSGRMQRIN
jgi:hypothetical protein